MDALLPDRRRSPHPVSVADLLCRYISAPAVEAHPPAVPPADPVPVSALLRREGRARRALDRPLVPRGHSRPAPDPAADRPPRRTVRRAGAVAGALFAAGAVFGATSLEEALLLRAPEAEAAEPGGPTGIGTAVTDGVPAPVVSLPSPGRPSAGAGPFAGFFDGSAPVDGAAIGRAALVPGPAAAPPGAGPVAPVPVAGPVAPAGPGDPGGVGPAPAPAPGAPSPAGPGGPPVTVPVPDLDTPATGLPGVTVGEGGLTTPDLGLSAGDDGLGVVAGETALVTPDARVGALGAGPVGLGTTSARLPDLAVEEAEVVRLGPEPEVTVPAATLSATEIETPPLQAGGTGIDLPDVALPEVSTEPVPVVRSVTGLLGG